MSLQESAQPTTKPPASTAIAVKDQLLMPADHVQLMAYIRKMFDSGIIPKHLKSTDQVLCAWNFAAQLLLPPQPSLRNIAVIEGSPSLFGDLPLALVQKHPDFMKIREYCVDDQYDRICVENKNLKAKAYAGVCELQRKGMDKPESYAFSVDDANRAGLIARAGGKMPWAIYPQIMLVRRARSMAIKSLFADAITGAAIAEYDFDEAPDLRDVSPVSGDMSETASIAAELNDEFATKDEQ